MMFSGWSERRRKGGCTRPGDTPVRRIEITGAIDYQWMLIALEEGARGRCLILHARRQRMHPYELRRGASIRTLDDDGGGERIKE